MHGTVRETHYEHANDFFLRLLDEWTVQRKAYYRGEADAAWELRPSAWRSAQLVDLANLLALQRPHDSWMSLLPDEWAPGSGGQDKYLTIEGASLQNLKALVWRLRAESVLIDSFCDHCDSVALPVPGVSTARARVPLIDLLCNFYPDAFPRFVPGFQLTPAHALAQHSGVPTRLLDFSENPLKAAFFAVSPGSTSNSQKVAVWIARKRAGLPKFEDGNGDVEIIHVLRSQVEFLHAQDGMFIACNELGNRHFLTHGTWPTMDLVMSEWLLEKITLPREEVFFLRSRLERAGITASRLMPSYSQIASNVCTDLLNLKEAGPPV